LPLLDTLVLFNRVEHFGEAPPWRLFAEILPVVLDQLVDRATGAEPRLFVAVEDAARHLPPELIVPICKAWIGWLTRTTRDQLRSDYAWGVIDILLTATRERSDLREGLLSPLFSHLAETGAAVMLIHELVSAWGVLTTAEQDRTAGLINRSRKDGLWLKAVAMTNADRTEALERKILGSPMPADSLAVEAQLSPDLLQACIEVHLGVQPFGYLGLGARQREPWRSIVLRRAERPDDRLGPLCFQSLLRTERVDDLLMALPHWRSRLDEVFDLLVRHCLGTAGGPALKPVWRWIFNHAGEDQRFAFDRALSQSVAGLVDDLFELRSDLGLEFEEIPLTLESLSGDFRIMMAVNGAAETVKGDPDLTDEMLQSVLALVLHDPPRLFGTFDYVSGILKTSATRELAAWKTLQDERQKLLPKRDEAREDRYPEPEVDRGKWIGPL